MNSLEVVITEENSGRSVLSVLKNSFCASGTLIKRLKAENAILLDGEPVHTNVCVKCGQCVSIVCSEPTEKGETPSFPILYEDDDLLIVDKPAGMLVHATKANFEETTVASEVKRYLNSSFHPVNRLDRGTSGAMVIAKNGYIHNLLKNTLHTDSFLRIYLAVVCSCPSQRSGFIRLPIGRDEISPIKRVIDTESGQEAETYFEVLNENGVFSLVKVLPLTGRTHQIRVHMAAIGCPLAGDFLYGTECKSLITRCALHSYAVKLNHPLTHEIITVKSPLPDDMQKLCCAVDLPKNF